MKTILAFLFASCLCASAQSLVLTNHLKPTPKNSLTCVTPKYFYIAEAVYTNTAMFPSNKWYYPTTQIISATCTNPNVVISISSSFGATVCGKGSVSYTNPFYPQDTFAFNGFWSNSIPNPPTNGEWVPITVTGVRTNGP